MMIRKATPKDISAIEKTYTDLLSHEKNTVNYSNWQPGLYPTVRTAEKSVAAGTMFVVEEEHTVKASAIINREQAPCYAQIPWRFEAAPDEVLVIHTLCVPPANAGKGYASQIIDFAKTCAAKQHCRVIRLDTYIENEPAKTLYLKKGFCVAGQADAMLENVIPEKLIMLEYKI